MGALMLPAVEWQAADWQRLWLSIWAKKRPWRSLAIVPAGPGTPSTTILQIAVSMANAGNLYVKTPIHVADAAGILRTGQVAPFSAELTRYIDAPALVLLALPPLQESATALALARAADCALLCIVHGVMARRAAKQTVGQIGAAHFIGSALFHVNDSAPR
jgi:hypothetical protein